MSDLNFDKIIEKLKEIHSQFPDKRFGEVVQGAADMARMSSNANLFDISSKQMLHALEEYHRELRTVR